MEPVTLVILMTVFLGFSFFMQYRQRKQMQQRYEQLKKLSKGDQVITIGGLYAAIDHVDAEQGKVVLDADGIFLTYELIAIKHVVKAQLADGSIETTATAETAVEEQE